MIIRSQNKKELHNLEKISMIKVVTNSQKYFVEVNSQHTIGTYSTKEKAITVLDMIQNAYERQTLFSITYQEGMMYKLERDNGLYGAKNLISSVFQMPADEDVEV